MQKYLNLIGPAAAAFQGSQLVSINGIKTIRSANATSADTLIEYADGTTTTVRTAAQVGFDVVVQLQEAVKKALETPWVKPVYDVVLVKDPVSVVNA